MRSVRSGDGVASMVGSDSGPGEDQGGDAGMMDADDFLAFTSDLKAVHEQVDTADVTAGQRSRWQRRLVRITDGATQDLTRAGDQLRRLRHEVERFLRR